MRRPLLLALCVAALHGCAARPGAAPAEPEATQDLTTESDEPEFRRRARLRLELASGYFEQGQTSVALDEVKQSLAADPTYAQAYNLRGLVYLKLKEPRLAEASFQQALKLAPRDGDTWHNLGWMQCQDGRHAEAARSFASALAAPNYASAAKTWTNLGICQARAGQSADAEKSLTRAFELDTANPIAGYNLALLLQQRGEPARAQFVIRRLNHSEFANAESLWLGARIEHRLGNREAERQLGEQLRRRHPESKEAAAYERGSFDD